MCADRTSNENQYVIFRLGAETFGVNIARVKEIITNQNTTRLPGTSRHVQGVINLRGRVIPIYNLRQKFNLPPVEETCSSRIVVVEAGESVLGITVDGVSEVLMISDQVIEKPSRMITTSVDRNYINGIAKINQELVIILDLEKAVMGEELKVC
ncbi:MAG: chemotaxis protein CheW [Bacillota bacterium]